MNLNAYKEYYLSPKSVLISTESNNEYSFFIDKTDRFYQSMASHIMNGKVNGLTYETIDSLSIKDENKTFFDEKAFTLKAIMIATDKNNVATAYQLVIKNVRVISNNVSSKEYKNKSWNLKMYELEIQYNTDIEIKELG